MSLKQVDGESVLEISLPLTHDLCSYVPRPQEQGRTDNHEVFRTRAAILLKQAFGKDIFTLRETNYMGELSYRIAVKNPRIEEFRQKVSELGFRINGSK